MNNVNLNKMQLDESQAKASLKELIEGLELDLLTASGGEEEMLEIEKVLLPAIRRGRLVFDLEEITVSYKLKKPAEFKEGDSLDELIFSVDNCNLQSMKGLEDKAKKGELSEMIQTFAGAKTPLLTAQVIKSKFANSDVAICGCISTLFLAF